MENIIKKCPNSGFEYCSLWMSSDRIREELERGVWGSSICGRLALLFGNK